MTGFLPMFCVCSAQIQLLSFILALSRASLFSSSLSHIPCIASMISINVSHLFSALAEKCHAYAKALHYKELEFHTQPAATIEALISINNQLQQPEVLIRHISLFDFSHADCIRTTYSIVCTCIACFLRDLR